MARLDAVRNGYEDFLRRHPDSAHGYLAYGSFLNDIGDEEGAVGQYEKSRSSTRKIPPSGTTSPIITANTARSPTRLYYYAKAMALDPAEPVYYQNFATTVYLFRKDAREFYGINEQQVFDKALGLYRQAMKLAPDDFVLATRLRGKLLRHPTAPHQRRAASPGPTRSTSPTTTPNAKGSPPPRAR